MSESPVKNMYAEIQAGTDEKNSSSTIGPPTEIDSNKRLLSTYPFFYTYVHARKSLNSSK